MKVLPVERKRNTSATVSFRILLMDVQHACFNPAIFQTQVRSVERAEVSITIYHSRTKGMSNLFRFGISYLTAFAALCTHVILLLFIQWNQRVEYTALISILNV